LERVCLELGAEGSEAGCARWSERTIRHAEIAEPEELVQGRLRALIASQPRRERHGRASPLPVVHAIGSRTPSIIIARMLFGNMFA
jgi:hypothetical protein